MKNLFLVPVVAALVFLAPPVSAKIKKAETIEKTVEFRKTAGERHVIVDNVWGFIKVTGHSGNKVEMTAEKTIRADSDREYQEALDEVSLDITEEDGLVEFYVDGPFRCRNHRTRKGWRGKCGDYEVIYNFEIKVPRDVSVELSTVNDGEIELRGVQGDFDVHNVNGGIDISGLRGSGEAYSVNGDVTLQFDENPSSDCRFGALNGEVRIYFKPELSADFRLKTFNGEVFTDFAVSDLPVLTFNEIETNGKTVYKAGQLSGVRAGKGGPTIELDGFNGDMFILTDK